MAARSCSACSQPHAASRTPGHLQPAATPAHPLTSRLRHRWPRLPPLPASPPPRQVLKFNGTPLVNLKHLAELVIACQETFMRFDMDYNEVGAG